MDRDVSVRLGELELKWAVDDYPWLRDVLRERTVETLPDGRMSIGFRIEPRRGATDAMRRLERVMRLLAPPPS